MSANPRRVRATLAVTWPPGASVPTRVRAGTVLDCPAGSALENAYGGAGNLEILTAALGSPDVLDKSFLSN